MRSPALPLKQNWILWLVLIITLVYAPFLGFRVVRMAGDEKVYVSQALEMASQGHWFVQTLQGRPDYYKGPLHYILIRLGLILFGKTPWAALYMNYVLLIAGAIAIGALVRKYCPKWTGGAIWAGSFFATCVGIYAHSFASQMEVELAGLFAVDLFLLDRMGQRAEEVKPGFLFWGILGLIGWSKSPLHSVLGGTAAILFWLLSGQLWARLKNWRCWLAVFFGIAVCAVGYAPAYFFDRENFVNIYVIRETFAKASSEQPASVSLVSVFGFYLFPWLLLCLVAYGELFWNLIARRLTNYPEDVRRAMLMGACWMFPSCAFFAYIPYHFENYNLPFISGVILVLSLVIGYRSARTNSLYRAATVATALVLLALPISLTVFTSRFSPLPQWYPTWLMPFSWVATLSSVLALIYFGWLDRLRKMHTLAIGMTGFFLALVCTITVVGERELVDLRSYLTQTDLTGHHVRQLGYYNLHYNIWSEWGFLNLWIDRPVYEIHDPERLKSALLAGETVIIPARGPLTDFRAFAQKELPNTEIEMTPWRRWLTQGRSESGQSLWSVAWEKRDVSVLETDYYIARKIH